MLTRLKTTKKAAALTGVAGAALIFGLVGPISAAPVGRTNAEWDGACATVHAQSVKDISNVVYMLDGVEHRIEFEDGTHDLQLPGEITDLWIKAGNNKSGDGAGYGEHYARPDRCNPSMATMVAF